MKAIRESYLSTVIFLTQPIGPRFQTDEVTIINLKRSAWRDLTPRPLPADVNMAKIFDLKLIPLYQHE